MLGDSSPPSFRNALPRGWYEGLILGSLPGQTSSARTMSDAPSKDADFNKVEILKNFEKFQSESDFFQNVKMDKIGDVEVWVPENSHKNYYLIDSL